MFGLGFELDKKLTKKLDHVTQVYQNGSPLIKFDLRANKNLTAGLQ